MEIHLHLVVQTGVKKEGEGPGMILGSGNSHSFIYLFAHSCKKYSPSPQGCLTLNQGIRKQR